jgi:hypothetical protein
MRRFAFFCCAAILAGCTKSEDRAVEDEAAGDRAASAARSSVPTTISLADVAGKWKLRSMDPDGGNPAEAVLIATADTSGWTYTGPNREPVPVRVVAVGGDSIVTEQGPYESLIRKGVQVRLRTVSRLQGEKLVGTVEARYATRSGDSVAHRRTEATRMP